MQFQKIKKDNYLIAEDPTFSCWVNASAGSGKTQLLVNRLISLLKSGVDPQKILCLTFTKTAALEMAQRLIEELRALYLSTNSEYFRNILLKILENPIPIQTIHSFCQSLLCKFPIESNVGFNFRILEDEEKKNIFKESIDFFLNKKIEETSILWNESLFQELLWEGVQFKKIGNIDNFNNVNKSFTDIEFENQLWNNFCLKENIEIKPFDDYKTRFLNKNNEIKIHFKSNPIAKKIKDFQSITLEVKLLKNNKSFLKILKEVRLILNEKKKKEQYLDFNDLLFFSLKLLKNSSTPWVLYRIAGSIQHLLIDEAQDTSSIQWDFIQALSQEYLISSDRTIFIVGDPKQSIYKFQGADPHLFLEKENFFKKLVQQINGKWKKIQLNISYRTNSVIIEAIDKYFTKNIFGITFGKEYIRHIAFKKSADSDDIIFWPLCSDSSKLEEEFIDLKNKEIKNNYNNNSNSNSEDIQKNLSLVIANKIQDLINSKIILKSTGKIIKEKDIFILVRRRTVFIDFLSSKLKKKNILVANTDKSELNKHQIIQDLIAFSKFLLYQNDDFSLACFLKSPIINIDERRLFNLCYNRSESLWNIICKDDKSNDLRFFLNYWIKESKNRLLYDFYSLFISKVAKYRFWKRFGRESEEILNCFLENILSYEGESNPLSIQSFVDYIDNNSLIFNKQILNHNGIKILTIHGSKGLESPVVILVDSPDIKNLVRSNFLEYDLGNEKQGIILRPPKLEDYEFTKQLKKNQEKCYDEETNRLLYVAMTRAKDKLFITGWENRIGKAKWYRELFRVLQT